MADERVRKQFSVGIKAADDKSRTIQLAITTLVVDRSGEVVIPKGGRFEEYLTNPIVLFGHNSHDLPIGACLELAASDKDVTALTRFAGLDQLHPFAETVYRLYRDGFMRASSVGFQPVTISQDKMLPGQTGITYREWNLLEYSCVPVPANPQALARMMKAYELPNGATEKDLEDAIFVRPRTWFDVASAEKISEGIAVSLTPELIAKMKAEIDLPRFSLSEDPQSRPQVKSGGTMTSLVARMLGLFKNPMPNAEDYESLAEEFLQSTLIPPEFRAYTPIERLALAAVYEVPSTVKEFETGFDDAWFEGRKIDHGNQVLIQLKQTAPGTSVKNEQLFMLIKPPTPGKDAAMRLVQVTDEMQESLIKGLGKPRKPALPDPDLHTPEPTIAQQVQDLAVTRATTRAIRKALGDDYDDAQDQAEEVVILDTMDQLIGQCSDLMKTLTKQHGALVALQTAGDDPDLEDVKEIAQLQMFELSIRQLFATLGALCAQSCFWLQDEMYGDVPNLGSATSPMYSGSVVDGMVIKAGRVLSGKNLSKLKQAATHITDVIDDHESRIPAKPSDAVGSPGSAPTGKNAPNPDDTPSPKDDVKPDDNQKPGDKKPKPEGDKPGDKNPGPGDQADDDGDQPNPKKDKKPPKNGDNPEGQAGGSDADDQAMSVDDILGKIFTPGLFPVH